MSAILWDHSGEGLAVGGTSWAEEGSGAQVVSVELAGCELQPAGLQGACVGRPAPEEGSEEDFWTVGVPGRKLALPCGVGWPGLPGR